MATITRLMGTSIHSVKGGIGKSTLAVYIALRQALDRPQAAVYLVDLDLTGTSLGDALPLWAPRWDHQGSQEQPLLNLDNAPDGYLPRADTIERIAWRE